METMDEKTLRTIAAKVTEDIERRGGFAVKSGVFIATEDAELKAGGRKAPFFLPPFS